MRTGWSQGMVAGLESVSKCATRSCQGRYSRSLRLEGSTGPFLLQPPIVRVALRLGRWRRNLGLEQTLAGAGFAGTRTVGATFLGQGEKASQEVHGANRRGVACPCGCCSCYLRVLDCRSYCSQVFVMWFVCMPGVKGKAWRRGGGEAKRESRLARVLISQSAPPRL
jgi:hypothetical protein